jgi:hypothetical protein
MLGPGNGFSQFCLPPLVASLPESDERRALLWMQDFVVVREK